MTTQIINSADSLQRILGRLRSEWGEHKYLKVSYVAGCPRSLDANAVTHVWYGQISRERGDMSEADVKAECKLRFGVPILRAEDEEFRESYDRLIRGRYTYEEKLEMMHLIPVTSRMTTKQLNRYRDEMQQKFAEQGIILEYLEKEAA